MVNGRDVSIRTMPGTTITTSSLPDGWKPYVYKGTGVDVLTPRMKGGRKPKTKPEPLPGREPEPDPVEAQDEPRLLELEKRLAARGVIDEPRQIDPEPDREPEPLVKPAARCDDCGYLVTAPGHLLTCRSAS